MQDNREITNEEVQKASEIINNLLSYYNSKVVGQPYLGYSLLVAMMTNGHVLLESVPGLAKTTAARVMTEAVNGSFSRIQCTPDLIPSDIIGTQMYNMATNTFEDKIGPVYSNFVLLDEINRSSAKTQSAMLEAMQEREVSIGGKTYKLPEVFVVIATQNPIVKRLDHFIAFSNCGNIQTTISTTVFFTNDHVLGNINQTTSQVT